MKKIEINPYLFRPYDIRGAEEKYVKSQQIEPGSLRDRSAHGAILNPEIAYVIGRSIADIYQPKSFVVGRDDRLTSPALADALIEGLRDAGVDVDYIGISTSDLLYFAIGYHRYEMGVMITGSHTIKSLNGMKISRLTGNSVTPIYTGYGMEELRDYTLKQDFKVSSKKGRLDQKNIYDGYTEYILSHFPDYKNFKRLKLILDAGNGTAGVVYGQILESLPVDLVKLNFEPDGNFPAHDPDPAVFENMKPLVEEMQKDNAEFGVAWDGDADRIAFISPDGEILTGSHMGSLFLPWVMERHPKAPTVVTPPMTRAYLELAEEYGSPVIYAKVGNSFVKHMMDLNNSPYGAEEADHFMFAECFGTENGIIPLLIILDRISKTGKSYNQLLNEAKRGYHLTGDINIEVRDSDKVLLYLEKHFKEEALEINKLDGLRVEFDNWRFCIRPSSIDPVVRLNLEAKSEADMKLKTELVVSLVEEAEK